MFYQIGDYSDEELLYYKSGRKEIVTRQDIDEIDGDRLESIHLWADATFWRKDKLSTRESFRSDLEYRIYLGAMWDYADMTDRIQKGIREGLVGEDAAKEYYDGKL